MQTANFSQGLVSLEERFRAPRPVNAMTVDVEDYFQVSAFAGAVSRDSWDRRECRVERNVESILALFGGAGIRATFFTLGWVAERYPRVIRAIVAAGHELASHGYAHIRATDQDPTEFRADVERTRKLLEDVSGQPVAGYRATSYSIVRSNLWALDVLAQAGYRYSSSIYPISHDLYGIPEAPRFAFRFEHNGLIEIPVTTCEIGPWRMPCGGGGYFRLLPYRLARWAIRRVNRVDEQPAIFYFHPWEIDPDQPRVAAGLKSRFRHYLNLRRMRPRLHRLLRDFQWDRVDRVFGLAT